MTAFWHQDLTDRGRFGLAGTDAARMLTGLGADLPAADFGCVEQGDGSLIARLSPVEFLWLDDPGAAAAVARQRDIGESSAGYLIHWRSSHAWFAMGGEGAAARLAEICGLDLAGLAAPRCLPAMLARIPAWLFFRSFRAAPCFHLLVPSPHAAAIWNWIVAPRA